MIRIVDIPPYQRAGVNYDPQEGHFMMHDLVESLRARGHLDGVEITVDEGYPTDHGAETRDDEVVTNIAVGVVKRIKAVCAMNKYDAVITQAGIEPGFLAAMSVSTLPLAYPVHSAMHFASLLGEKFCALTTTDAQAMIVRRNAQIYGMNHKLTSVRYASLSSTGTMALVRKYPRGPARAAAPEVRRFVNTVVEQFSTAIENEGVDSVIIASPHQQCFLEEVRAGLDEKGYQEVNLIGAFPAAVQMARAMVAMGLRQSPRAYPTDALKAKPAFR